MFWIIVAVVPVVLLGAMWRHDRRRRVGLDMRTADNGRGQGTGARYAPPSNPGNLPGGF